MRHALVIAVLVVLLVASLPAPAGQASAVPPGFRQVFSPPLVSDRLIVDLRYNTDDNFLGRNVYARHGVNRCWIHPIMAERLEHLLPILARQKLKLVLWDCWRPLSVQQEMWKIMPDSRYVADPAKGSNHNRGLAIDAALADDEGRLLPMPTGFDDFSEKAAPSHGCAKKAQELCANRDLQIELMKAAGLEVLPTEWWHYQPAGVAVERYPVR